MKNGIIRTDCFFCEFAYGNMNGEAICPFTGSEVYFYGRISNTFSKCSLDEDSKNLLSSLGILYGQKDINF